MLKLGLICLCLLACASCSSKPLITARPVLVRSAPPAALMRCVPEPPCNATTTGDLVGCWQDMRAALRRANANLDALRKWVEAVDQEPEEKGND